MKFRNMKKLLLLMMVSVSLLFTSCEKECINQNVNYANVDVFNPWGNVVDFQFSYDACDECTNNFIIKNNANAQVYYNFNIYQNGSLVYLGYFNVSPYGSIMFNNAFTNCNSSSSGIVINIW